MAKADSKLNKDAAENFVVNTLPWSCTHFGDQSEIEAFVPATGRWETIADVHSVGDIDAEDIADFIVRLANEFIKEQTP